MAIIFQNNCSNTVWLVYTDYWHSSDELSGRWTLISFSLDQSPEKIGWKYFFVIARFENTGYKYGNLYSWSCNFYKFINIFTECFLRYLEPSLVTKVLEFGRDMSHLDSIDSQSNPYILSLSCRLLEIWALHNHGPMKPVLKNIFH